MPPTPCMTPRPFSFVECLGAEDLWEYMLFFLRRERLRVSGSGFRVCCSMFRGLGLRVEGLGFGTYSFVRTS